MKTLLLSLAFAVALPSAAIAAPAPVVKAGDECGPQRAKDKKVCCCEKMKREAASKSAPTFMSVTT